MSCRSWSCLCLVCTLNIPQQNMDRLDQSPAICLAVIQNMKYGQLISLAEQMVDTYNEKAMTPDSHAEEFLAKQSKMQDTERVFLKQVFYGVDRYREFLSAFTRILFSLYPARANRSDCTLFHIFTYIICFRLDELPFGEFRRLVLSQPPVKMNVLFDLLLDVKKVREHVRGEWSKCLDEGYIDEMVIGKLEQRVEMMAELIATVCEKATGKKSDLVMTIQSSMGVDTGTYSKKQAKKQPTVPEPFNLTKPKVKLVPEPQKIEVGVKARPAPAVGKSTKDIEAEKNKRREEIRENVKKFYEQNQKEFELKAKQRPTNLEKVKKQVEQTMKKQLRPRKFAKPVPKFGEVQTKLNVAAILREEKKLQQKIAEQQKRLKDLEINMRDDSEFQSWQNDVKARDKYQELENQQRKKIEMELARQAAMKAYQEKVEENKQLVQAMKEVADQLRQEREQLEAEDLEEKKKIVVEVQEAKENILIEREKVVERNKKVHDQGKEEIKRILEKKKEEEEIEMKKKKELIKEIRELEKISKVKPKVLNSSETMGYGLLQQMSLQQLRERLVQAQQAKKQQQQQKRSENLKKKNQFARAISEKKDKIMNNRAEQSRIRQEQRERKRKEQEQQRQRIEQVKLKSQQEFKKRESLKLQQKKQQQQKLNKQLKEIEQRRQFMNENQAAVQANAFKNQELGAQRQMLERQNVKLVSRQKAQRVKLKQTKIIAEQAKKQIQAKVDFDKLYNQNRQEANQVKQMMELQDNESKAVRYQSTKQYELKHTQNMTQLNEYKTKISELNLTKAKQSLSKSKK